MTALVGKSEVPLEAALSRAAEILAKSRMPVITGPGTDVAGMRAALRLAARLGGAVDFCRSQGLLNYCTAMTDIGLALTTPREARARGDVLLIIGPAAGRSEQVAKILAGTPVLSAGAGTPRDVIWLCEGGAGNALSSDEVMKLGGDLASVHGILAMLNACLRGHPLPEGGYGGLSRAAFEEVAGRLLTARFGVIAWGAEDLDALAIQSLMAATITLNKTTRVTTLPLAGPGAGQTAAAVTGWTTGFPPRVGFARGFPEYDPWRFDAARMVTSGECDALVWVSSFEAAAPGWKTDIPLIALTAPGAVFAKAPDIFVLTAVPGVNANAEFYSEAMQTLIHANADNRTDDPAPASVLEDILNKLEAVAT